MASAFPWNTIAETGRAGAQSTSRAPATGAMAATTSLISQPSRWAIIAPFDMPVAKIRWPSTI